MSSLTDTQEEKRALRKATKARLDAFFAEPARAKIAGEKACAYVARDEAFLHADTVFLYMPMEKEADCTPLIEIARAQNKRIAIPRVIPHTSDMDFYLLDNALSIEEQTETGGWGIREPKTTLSRFEPELAQGNIFVIVPGVAFTKSGKRLGHGKGYYDRYISRLQKSKAHLRLCGFCYDAQFACDIPTDRYDMPMQAIASESGLIRISDK